MSSAQGSLLSYSVFGTGVPVVFLHPTPLDREYWRPVAERLPGVHATLADLRGHGHTPLGEGLVAGGFSRVADAPVLTMRRLAEDVLDLLDYLQLGQAVFAGCSIGGYVLLELWRLAPARVRGLAFVCSKPQPDTAASQAKRAATIASARSGDTARLYDTMVQTLTGATAQQQRPGIVSALRGRMDAVTAEALVATQAGLATRPDSVADVATIRVPVLAIAGGEDPAVTVDEMRAFEQAAGGCSFHVLETAGHFAAFEQPDAVAGLLRPWLAQFAD